MIKEEHFLADLELTQVDDDTLSAVLYEAYDSDNSFDWSSAYHYDVFATAVKKFKGYGGTIAERTLVITIYGG